MKFIFFLIDFTLLTFNFRSHNTGILEMKKMILTLFVR